MRSAIRSLLTPRFTITPESARSLMRIEAARTVVDRTPLPPAVAEELRRRARLRSVHYSTRIEGNRLTLEEAEDVIAGRKVEAAGRERDVREVWNYWTSFLKIEEWAARRRPLTEELIQRLHAFVEHGARAKQTPYRDGQNVIRDSASGRIIYLPPTAADVPVLMGQLVEWYAGAEQQSMPTPLRAGLVHYQFVTIHPYFDGNGRTARLLATYLLHSGGYGLGGIFSLEEYHARDLEAYYGALATHPNHNYYDGRAEADITPWLEYFGATLARVFAVAEEEALRVSRQRVNPEPKELRALNARERRIFALFAKSATISASDVARLFGFSDRAARTLLQQMVGQGILEAANSSNRARAYQLSEVYRKFIGRYTVGRTVSVRRTLKMSRLPVSYLLFFSVIFVTGEEEFL